jgi:hypothetical protein
MYGLLVGLPVKLVPDHEYEYGAVPPVTTAVHVTAWFTVAGEGLAEQLTFKATGGLMTRLKLVVRVPAVGFVPVTVIGYVPGFADGEIVRLTELEQLGVHATGA